MDRRQLIVGLAGAAALGARPAWAGGAETADGEGFFFRRGNRVHVFKQLRVTRGARRGEVELRLGTGGDALTLKGRLEGSSVQLTEGPGISSPRRGYLQSGAGGRPLLLSVGEDGDPDFYLAFISDERLGEAVVEDRSDARGTLKRPNGREVQIEQTRVLIAEEGQAFIKLKLRGDETGDQWFIGRRRSRGGSPHSVQITHFFRNPGELQRVDGASTATVEVTGRGRLRRLEVTVATDRGRLTASVRAERD